jgi:DNA-directed RNA polymerase subunit K/omega
MSDKPVDKTHFEELVEAGGGRFEMTVLVQRLLQELARGGFPMVTSEESRSLIDIALQEVLENKIELQESEADALLGTDE